MTLIIINIKAIAMSTYYLHNPRCSKSRQGLELISKKSFKFEVLEYIKTPLSKSKLGELFDLLNKNYDIKEFTRTKEKEFKGDVKTITKAQWVSLIEQNPKFIERPILFNKKKAILGRPPEALLKF